MGEPIKRDPQSGAISVRTSGFSETGLGIRPALPAALEIGTVLAQRYEIVALAGEGGMGHVYKAHDRELDRMVALKTIRPDLASNPSMLARFKQEVSLASSITHRNVIRLYDLGESGPLKFITMEFIEGEDLRSEILRRGKIPPEEAAEVMRQVSLALEAAHAVGVIHRDLKPQNIMREPSGRVVVMDFGLARTLTTSGMTQTGALVGTLEYMSPEQAMGSEIDSRSDLFAAGLIFYELITGTTPYQAESALASLLKRAQQPAVPPVTMDATIPKEISRIVCRCLERNPKDRYQSATELRTDLDRWLGGHVGGSLRFQAVNPWARSLPWHWIGAFVAVCILVALGYFFRGVFFARTVATAPAAPSIGLAIVPFRNASGDASLDWLGTSLAEMLSTNIGQSSTLHSISPDRVHQIVNDLHITPSSSIDPSLLQKIAEFSSAEVLVSGQYVRFGNQIRIDAFVRDVARNSAIPLEVETANEKDIPGAIDRLANEIRHNMSLSADVIKKLEASSFQPTSTSPEALRNYNEGLHEHREGKNLQAVKSFETATHEDASFALAFSGLAEAYSDLGYDSDAERASRRAIDLSQQLPLAEKYLIQASHSRIVKDSKKAIESYENLAKSLPGNVDIQYALGSLYIDQGDYVKARAQFAKILEQEPKNIRALWQMGAVEIMSDNPQGAIDPLSHALALAIQVDNQEQKALILQAMGVSYRVMNKPEDAMRNYQQSMEINRRLGLKRNLAVNLTEMAQVQSMTGNPDAALKSYSQALQIQKEIGAKKESGDTLIGIGVVYENKGDYDKALQSYKDSLQIQRDVSDRNYEALCLSNIGGAYLAKGDTENALTYLQQALQLRQQLNVPGYTAETLSRLGDVYTSTGRYDEALSSYLKALGLWRQSGDVRGAASVSHSMGLVFRNQSRYEAALSAIQDAVKAYQSVGDRSRDMAETLVDLATTMGQMGRGDEAAKPLEDAQSIASDLKNESIRAAVINAQGDLQYYRGDLKAARSYYEDAQRAAARGKEHDKVVVSRLNLMKVSVAEGHPATAIGEYQNLIQQANSLGLKYLAIASAIDMSRGMIAGKEYPRARQELETALNKSEKLGLRLQTARIHCLLGDSLRLSGNAGDAASQYRQASAIMEELQKQPGAEHLFDRADLRTMYADSQRFKS